jgi:hypothetical protein
MLPPLLMRHLADANVEVLSWSAQSEQLVLRVRKEIGPETGLLRFGGVCQVNLPSRMTLAGIRIDENNRNETTFILEEAWGASHFIVAESVSYQLEVDL